jgi:hypothetical protein
MTSLWAPLGGSIRLTESTGNRTSIRVVISCTCTGVISVGSGLVGVKMRKRRHRIGIISKVGRRVVCMCGGGRSAGKGNFGAGVEASSTGVMYRKGMRVTAVTSVGVKLWPLDSFVIIEITKPFPGKLPNKEGYDT